MGKQSLTLALIAGEESGQLLAADLVAEISDRLGKMPRLVGVGGGRLAGFGLESLFDPQDIALMGVVPVIKALPRLMKRIRTTADRIIAERPDCLLLVDSPDFSLRVAKRVKRALPDLPVVKYVCPSVWAWRPGRAAAMRSHVDHVLAILPFEPAVMQRLGGPPTHYVGHRLTRDADLARVWEQQAQRKTDPEWPRTILLLPGSRRSEIRKLLGDFEAALRILTQDLGAKVSLDLPTLPHLENEVRAAVARWPLPVNVTTGRPAQMEAFSRADMALAASGTVTLELALAGIPAVSCYRSDVLVRLASSLITTWSACLPNLIADRVVVPEYYDTFIRPGMLARLADELSDRSSLRRHALIEGYGLVRSVMATDRPASAIAADVVMPLLRAPERT